MKRAKHNLGNYRITAGDMGYLYPFSTTEVLPGDTMRIQSSALIRLQPLMTPLMHPVRISIAHWFVPNRLVWSDWESFITGRDVNVRVPQLGAAVVANSTADYMGVAVGATDVSELPVRAYNKVFNEFYRDQDIQTERGEGDMTVAAAAWEKDYFTTSRSQPQKGGSVGATISFEQDVPVVGIGLIDGAEAAVVPNTLRMTNGATETRRLIGNDQGLAISSALSNAKHPAVRIAAGTVGGNVDINEWRRAMALQRFAEHRNKYSSRYKDYLAYLGVNSPDARLDRPEYLGGGAQTISFSEVLQSVESETVPLGTMGGHGIANVSTTPLRKMFTEHGYIISTITIRPKSMYTDATDRTWFRELREDFWQKEDEVLGEQPVLNKELYPQSGDPGKLPFGYSPRHDDYRTQRSYVTGPMRGNPHDTWHMARKFNAPPALNGEFIRCEPTKRVFRSQEDPQWYGMVQNRISARRLVRKTALN